MAIQIVGISVLEPGELLGAARSVVEWTTRVTTLLIELPERVASMLDSIDRLLARTADMADRVEGLVGRLDNVVVVADTVAGGAAATLERAGRVTGEADRIAQSAALVLAETAGLSRGAESLLAVYRPLAEQAAPLASAFVTGVTEREVAAAVAVLRLLPELMGRLETQIAPLVGRLDGVGPDVHELVAVVKELQKALNSVPGVAYLRRRMP